MRLAKIHSWLLLCCWASFGWASSPFSTEERAWLARHPVVRYAIDPHGWPIEYLEDGKHKGLTQEYLQRIADISGIRFQLVPVQNRHQAMGMLLSGKLDLVTATSPRLIPPPFNKQMLFSDPYFSGSTLLVTRPDKPIVFDPSRLSGKMVAVEQGDPYEYFLREHYPEVRILQTPTPLAALDAVANGDAYAAVGLDAILQSVIQRRYYGKLHIAGSVSEMPRLVSMAVNQQQPMLRDIINAALGQLTAEDTDNILYNWLRATDYGTPTVGSIIRHYWVEFSMLAVALLLLLLFSQHARTAKRAAQRSEADKSLFLAMMSHEIRTPLNAVLASVELLRGSMLPPRERELVALANASAVNLLELLDNVLDISKLDARKLLLEPVPIDMAALASGVAGIYRPCAEKKGLALTTQLSGLSDVRVWLDPVRMRQILSNLLSNAVKFTHQGEVLLRVELQQGESGNGTLLITVQDTGIGIALEQQGRLFKAYAQAGDSRQGYGGSGLGLAICRQLVELMSGSISLSSLPDRGTTMTLRLPVDSEPAPAVELVSPPSGHGGLMEAYSPVLVVEDQPANRFVIGQQLETLGFRSVMAEDAAAALALLDQGRRFSLVLLDCNLPDMDGYELARRLRQHPALQWQAYLPIVAISATTGIEHQQRCLESGMDSSLTKPLQLAQLENILILWLDHQAAEFEATAPPLPASAGGALEEIFRVSARDDMAELEKALAERNWPQARHHAHRLHGAALSADKAELAVAAARLEDALLGGDNNAEHLQGLLAALAEQLD
ncbi:sensor protein evgS [Chromobacterium phragmitis]|uniref:ATP-binding protein n=1 Tax=Chromobacterium phragmitis TaxID=2202141 RepID=UPI000DEC7003|nr:transporter substrate-binding domain-containing protein [Chromobacterium phragmitis]AXE31857.1 sensor protein evgS [Chromobacterium phragmitis]